MSPEQPTMPIPDGSVVITPNQQYAELRALTDAVKYLTGKVDPALVDLRKDVDEVRADLRTHVTETRAEISALQKWRYVLSGAFGLLTLLVGWGALNLTSIGG